MVIRLLIFGNAAAGAAVLTLIGTRMEAELAYGGLLFSAVTFGLGAIAADGIAFAALGVYSRAVVHWANDLG